MKSAAVNSGDNILASQYDNLRADAYGGSMLLPHQQSTPGLTLKVEQGVCYIGITRVIYAGGNSPSFTAPSANPRIDLLTIDSSGTIAITQGTENASPVAPTYPTNKMVLCEVYNRVGESSIKDVDDSTNGYIYNDVRQFIGGSYIADKSQIAAGALDGTLFANLAGIPSGAGIIPNANLPIFAAPKFGGNGADGALSISSGTTTIDLAGASVLIKNYSSISITGTGKLAFINPHANGSLIILRSSGNVTLTSSTVPCIDASSMGAAGGAGGGGVGNGSNGAPGSSGNNPSRFIIDSDGHGGGGASGPDTNSSSGGGGGAIFNTATKSMYVYEFTERLYRRSVALTPGAGGGGGASGKSALNDSGATVTGAGGAGGNGGGALLIECGGLLNFTGTVSVNGGAAANGGSPSGTYPSSFAAGGGGGGGAHGMALILYNSLTANTGTITNAGGAGGTGGTMPGGGGFAFGGAGGGGGGGAGAYAGVGGAGAAGSQNAGSTGSSSPSNGAGGGGGSGGGCINSNFSARGGGSGGSGGSSIGGLVINNTEFT